MKFSREQLGRLAMSAIVGVLGFVVLNRSCGVIPDVVIWWLLYAVGSGVILNTEEGESVPMLAKLAVVPALVPVATLLFFVLAEQVACLSFQSRWMPLLFPVASWVGIFLFSFARPPLGKFVVFIIHPGTKKRVERATTVLQLLISGIAAVVLALSSLGSK